MNKYIMLCMSMLFLHATAQTENMKQVDSLPSSLELYFEQTVSVEIENFVHKVASTIGFTTKITVVQPSNYAIETNAAFKVIVLLQVPQILLSIHSDWFNSLTQEERFFGIALQLMNNLPSKEAEECKKKFDALKGKVKNLLLAC